VKPIYVVVIAAVVISSHSFAAEERVGTITIDVSNIRSEKGVLRCALWQDPKTFAKSIEHALKKTAAPKIEGKRATCVFENIAAGTYAATVFHDENANHQVDKNFIGIPTEGLGFSNGAKPRMGPPSFDDAKFIYDGGPLKLSISPG
jgi:uncharacterized protein (DUF2141 family)